MKTEEKVLRLEVPMLVGMKTAYDHCMDRRRSIALYGVTNKQTIT
jgi:hypothetical protein